MVDHARQTLPTWVRSWPADGPGIDAARKIILRDPALAKLGIRLGAARVYTQAEADQILAALMARRARLAAAAK